MKFFINLTLFCVIVFSTIITAQRGSGNSGQNRGGGITGIVVDAVSDFPIEYANLVVLRTIDTSQVKGTVTESEGEFTIKGLRPGNYFLKASFIGYKSKIVENIEIENGGRILDVGTIILEPKSYQIDEAEVVGNRSGVEYRIDKKVINVSEQSTSISGNAVDVLENVPSVTVDIEGNVSLRGSGSFTLLIDGRPSILDANDALQQIPASTIENIEIITNPSAKYDSEGASGIINIVTKKNSLEGMSGVAHLNVGLDEKYGGDFLTNYKVNGHTYNIGAHYNTRFYPGTQEEKRITYNDEMTSYLNSQGTNNRGRSGYSIRGGADFTLSKNNQLGFAVRYGDRKGENTSDIFFEEHSEPETEYNQYLNKNYRERGGNFFSSNLNYKSTFGPNQHELLGEVVFQKRNSNEQTINEYREVDGTITSGRKNTEDGPSTRFRLKLDYNLPIGMRNRIETGVQSQIGEAEDDTKSFVFNGVDSGYIIEPDYSYLVIYERNIHSLYGTFSSKLNKFGYQVGLRGEYTFRDIRLVETNENSQINRMDYFPTVHASYSFTDLQQLMASYTRRIRRPRGWQLEPFEVWEDANNVRKGNPTLDPEYIDSYELAMNTYFGESLFSIEGYYRIRYNKIERVRAVYAPNVTISTFANVGTDYTLGTEFMLNTDIVKFWNINFLGDLSKYLLKGEYEGNAYSRDNFNWRIRLNNSFYISESTKLQINGSYNGPSISVQSEREAYYRVNMALRQEFWDKKIVTTLQVNDVFQTSKREGTTTGPGFESYNFGQRNGPIVMLNISFNFNNFKEKKERENGDGEEDF